MSSKQITHLYRSLLREVRLASKKPRATRNPVVVQQIRTLVDSSLSGNGNNTSAEKILIETRDFMRATRIHAELLQRYNPIHGMSEEERIKATARRVGLDTPVEFKGDKE
ncbi:hypothetical protein I317_07000 [Kwoniella heveanensis CBS 569]|uniref:Mitochondrial protein n=1 Tax=Kwoniella heveanensis BCC8398 TaxID=1296120 RepID=A0A1B9GQT5_9TREE|nr:hypothetical protein I316_04810 [Kwoniella heveanensis BCC8398]OCF39231.1 hypothetical protein I317_07000 [Kwoniella heveanensis CBS 569]